MTRRRYPPRIYSGCCRARVEFQRCSECHAPAPWRTRLTEEEAEKIAARERAAAVTVVKLTKEQAREALWGGYDD